MEERLRNPPLREWLDVHGHFQLPQTQEEAEKTLRYFHAGKFMVSNPVMWNAEEVLRFLDASHIRLQMLSYIPTNLEVLERANHFGASIVRKYPERFGLLAALPTDNPTACLKEIHRTTTDFSIPPDGFAVCTSYNDCKLDNPHLDPVWEELNNRKSVVHIHPNASKPPPGDLATPLIEAPLETTRIVVDMLYKGVFKRYPDVKFILAHAGGALPVLSGRLQLLGTEEWVVNPQGLSRDEIKTQLAKFYLDTAATAKTGLAPAINMCGVDRCIYGSDCGVPCSTSLTMDENKADVVEFERQNKIPSDSIGANGWELFPAAAQRSLGSRNQKSAALLDSNAIAVISSWISPTTFIHSRMPGT